MSGLGNKLDAILIQLPPKAEYHAAVADAFFRALGSRIPVSLFIEPRHASWFTADVNASLMSWRVARVAADPAFIPDAARPGGWMGRVYYRLHGSPRTYYSPYSQEDLATLCRQIDRSVPAWCVFDNTAAGFALNNALDFANMTGG